MNKPFFQKLLYLLLVSVVALAAIRIIARSLVHDTPALDEGRAFQLIAHEGGGVDGKTYTNSVEAFQKSSADGFKLFEFDLIRTLDGSLVGAHDWGHFRDVTGAQLKGDIPMTSAEFAIQRVLGKYTPVTPKDINHWMELYKDIYLVTDKTNDYSLIQSSFIYQDRIFIEVFGPEAYLIALNSGIARPIYSMGFGSLKGWLFQMAMVLILGPKYIACPYGTIQDNPVFFSIVKALGARPFVFTLNDMDAATTLIHKYGAVIYTDFLIPADLPSHHP